jgi:endonuclease YncB( thermonuclease family)
MIPKNKAFVLFLTFLPVFLFGYMTEEKLRYVIDGDTAQFQSMRCRFSYVDTPESGNNPKALRDSRAMGIPLEDIYDAGRIAKRYVKSRLHKDNYYRIDVKKGMTHGRKICVIYLDEEHTINELLVRDGFAVPFWKYIPKRMRYHYRKLALLAKKEHKGLWRLHPLVMIKMMD